MNAVKTKEITKTDIVNIFYKNINEIDRGSKNGLGLAITEDKFEKIADKILTLIKKE